AWESSDATLRSELPAMAGDKDVAGFFFSDEPDPFACPQAPAQHRARSKLIHALDPGKFTVMVSDSNSGKASLSQIALWVGAADYVGLNPYVCYQHRACDFAWQDAIIKAANRAKLRYWGVVQAFPDSDWRWPTPREERRMLARWSRSRESGSMTFAWKWAGHSLRSRPALLDVLRRFNLGRPPDRSLASTAVTEVHYTYTSRTSVSFDWVGAAKTLRYGLTTRYGASVVAHVPRPLPFSSGGPFREAAVTRLRPGTTYH